MNDASDSHQISAVTFYEVDLPHSTSKALLKIPYIEGYSEPETMDNIPALLASDSHDVIELQGATFLGALRPVSGEVMKDLHPNSQFTHVFALIHYRSGEAIDDSTLDVHRARLVDAIEVLQEHDISYVLKFILGALPLPPLNGKWIRFSFGHSLRFADGQRVNQIMHHFQDSSIPEETKTAILKVLESAGVVQTVSLKAGDIVPLAGWDAFRTELKENTREDLFGILGIQELLGTKASILDLVAEIPNEASYEEGRQLVYSKMVSVLEEQIHQGGPTFDLNIDEMMGTEASRLIPAILESRKNEITSLTFEMDDEGFVNIGALRDTYYGRQMIEGLASSKVSYPVVESINEKLAALDLKLRVENATSNDILKIVVWGPQDSGKSSIVQRFVSGEFEPTSDLRGRSIIRKDIDLAGRPVTLFVWDPLLHDNYAQRLEMRKRKQQPRRVYVGTWRPQYTFALYRTLEESLEDAQGLILVYSLADSQSFTVLGQMMNDIAAIYDHKGLPPIAIAGNMAERLTRTLPARTGQGQLFAQEISNSWGGTSAVFHPVSAKNGDNIDAMFEDLVRRILKRRT